MTVDVVRDRYLGQVLGVDMDSGGAEEELIAACKALFLSEHAWQQFACLTSKALTDEAKTGAMRVLHGRQNRPGLMPQAKW